MITSDLFNNKLFENAEFGTYYCEQLAKKVFENDDIKVKCFPFYFQFYNLNVFTILRIIKMQH